MRQHRLTQLQNQPQILVRSVSLITTSKVHDLFRSNRTVDTQMCAQTEPPTRAWRVAGAFRRARHDINDQEVAASPGRHSCSAVSSPHVQVRRALEIGDQRRRSWEAWKCARALGWLAPLKEPADYANLADESSILRIFEGMATTRARSMESRCQSLTSVGRPRLTEFRF